MTKRHNLREQEINNLPKTSNIEQGMSNIEVVERHQNVPLSNSFNIYARIFHFDIRHS
ncbi:MAG: hypothetical protein HC803_00195 [Saprospiraceae bacterium]|nr:hypothetical protein [Saprospiraceae bacterium]